MVSCDDKQALTCMEQEIKPWRQCGLVIRYILSPSCMGCLDESRVPRKANRAPFLAPESGKYEKFYESPHIVVSGGASTFGVLCHSFAFRALVSRYFLERFRAFSVPSPFFTNKIPNQRASLTKALESNERQFVGKSITGLNIVC